MTARMRAVNFNPWVGKHYWDKPFLGKRLLILRQNPYQLNAAVPLDECHSATTDMLLASLHEDRQTRHKRLAANLAGITGLISQDQAFKFWDSVAYYHYLQSVQDVATRAEHDEVWSNCKRAFQLVLEELQPQVVLVMNSGVWDELPLEQGTKFEVQQRKTGRFSMRETKTLHYTGGIAIAYFLGGPAILMSDPHWLNGHLRQLFKMV
jgi:hypothetical protein